MSLYGAPEVLFECIFDNDLRSSIAYLFAFRLGVHLQFPNFCNGCIAQGRAQTYKAAEVHFSLRFHNLENIALAQLEERARCLQCDRLDPMVPRVAHLPRRIALHIMRESGNLSRQQIVRSFGDVPLTLQHPLHGSLVALTLTGLNHYVYASRGAQETRWTIFNDERIKTVRDLDGVALYGAAHGFAPVHAIYSADAVALGVFDRARVSDALAHYSYSHVVPTTPVARPRLQKSQAKEAFRLFVAEAGGVVTTPLARLWAQENGLRSLPVEVVGDNIIRVDDGQRHGATGYAHEQYEEYWGAAGWRKMVPKFVGVKRTRPSEEEEEGHPAKKVTLMPTTHHVTAHHNTTQHNTAQHNATHHITTHYTTTHHTTPHRTTPHHSTTHHNTVNLDPSSRQILVHALPNLWWGSPIPNSG